jgi:hypothetical protein
MTIYNLTLSNGTATIAVDTNNYTNSGVSSLSIPGKSMYGFGKFYIENAIHMLENFASDTAPPNPLIGQLWYDTSSTPTLKYYDTNSAWSNTSQIDSSLLNLIDVNPTAPLDTQILKWDTTTSKAIWEFHNFDISTPQPASYLLTLGDVNSTTPTDNQILKWDAVTSSAIWETQDFTGTAFPPSQYLLMISDVDPTPSDGQILKWDTATSEAIWKTPAPAPENLVSLINVNPTLPIDGQILKWDTATSEAIWKTPTSNVLNMKTFYTSAHLGLNGVTTTFQGTTIRGNEGMNAWNLDYVATTRDCDLVIHFTMFGSFRYSNLASLTFGTLGCFAAWIRDPAGANTNVPDGICVSTISTNDTTDVCHGLYRFTVRMDKATWNARTATTTVPIRINMGIPYNAPGNGFSHLQFNGVINQSGSTTFPYEGIDIANGVTPQNSVIRVLELRTGTM